MYVSNYQYFSCWEFIDVNDGDTGILNTTNSLQEIEVFENMGLCRRICFWGILGIFEPNEHSNQNT